MDDHRFSFAIDPDRGPCHVGQLREYLADMRTPLTMPVYLREDGVKALDKAEPQTVMALSAYLLGHDAYDTVYAVERLTGDSWDIVLDDSYELPGSYVGLVLALVGGNS